jgi:hypothetical protein
MHELLQITFRGMAPSEEWAICVREQLKHLARFDGELKGCHATLERMPERTRLLGAYLMRVEVRTAKSVVIADRKVDSACSERELCELASAAFAAVSSRLEDPGHSVSASPELAST